MIKNLTPSVYTSDQKHQPGASSCVKGLPCMQANSSWAYVAPHLPPAVSLWFVFAADGSHGWNIWLRPPPCYYAHCIGWISNSGVMVRMESHCHAALNIRFWCKARVTPLCLKHVSWEMITGDIRTDMRENSRIRVKKTWRTRSNIMTKPLKHKGWNIVQVIVGRRELQRKKDDKMHLKSLF